MSALDKVLGGDTPAATPKGKSDVDDCLLFLATMKGGAVCSFEATRLALGHENRNTIEVNGEKRAIPEVVFAMFQGKFAIITPALIAGAFAERVKFRGYCVFILLWSLLIYCPLCHIVWGGGFLADGGNFAGSVALQTVQVVRDIAQGHIRLLGKLLRTRVMSL